jgi:hypothetical protein
LAGAATPGVLAEEVPSHLSLVRDPKATLEAIGAYGICTQRGHTEVDPGFLRQKWEPGFEVEIRNPVWGNSTQTGFLLTHQEPGFLEISKFRDPVSRPGFDENLEFC